MSPAVPTSLMFFLVLCISQVSGAGAAASIKVVARTQPTAALAAIEQIGAWWAKPAQPLELQPLLPAARPHQPWPYRTLSSAEHVSLTLTESFALEAAVVHGPLQGLTAEMLAWWFGNIDGDTVYAGDGRVWSKYLQWHPRDHIHQHHISPPTPTPAGGGSTSSGPAHSQGPLWEICEFFMCPEPAGYTATTYSPPSGPEPHTNLEYVVKEVTELQHLGSHSLSMTVPTRWGIGSSLWRLEHTWRDTPQGLVVSSRQVVGVVEPGWRPLWYARWRNALVRGMFARGRDAQWMLEQWLRHCVEEMGNLQHILPSLYEADRAGNAPNRSTGQSIADGQGSGGFDEL